MTWICPNCSQELPERPRNCPRCGFRSELSREYFWLYAAGILVIAAGFAFGILSVTIGEPGPGHWSRRFAGWFPVAPLATNHRWIAFLIEGILLTLAGLGITRHRWSSWFLLVLLCLWELGWTLRKLVTGEPGAPAPALASALLALEVLGLILAARLAVALRRTPERDVAKLQA